MVVVVVVVVVATDICGGGGGVGGGVGDGVGGSEFGYGGVHGGRHGPYEGRGSGVGDEKSGGRGAPSSGISQGSESMEPGFFLFVRKKKSNLIAIYCYLILFIEEFILVIKRENINNSKNSDTTCWKC